MVAGVTGLAGRVTGWLPAAPPPTAYRWERERSDFLLDGAKPGGGRQRRAEALARRAARAARAGAGAGHAGVQTAQTRSLTARLMGRLGAMQGFKVKALLFVVGAVLALVWLHIMWPALVAGAVGYELLAVYSPLIGRAMATRVRWALWAVSAALVLALGPGFDVLHLDPLNAFNHVPLGSFGSQTWQWLGWQAVLTPAVIASWVTAWGWNGVPEGAVKRPDRNADGTFRAPTASEMHAVKVYPGPGPEVVVVRRKKPAATPPMPPVSGVVVPPPYVPAGPREDESADDNELEAMEDDRD